MAEGGEDDEQKTEQPTQKRLDEALKKGNVPTSREVGHFFALGALALTVSWFGPGMMHNGRLLLTPFLESADSLPTDQTGLGKLLMKTIFGGVSIIIAPLLASMVAAISSGFMQHGFHASAEPLMPKLSKINPLEGIKRLFSTRSVVELVKNFMKLGIVGGVAFMAVYPELPKIRLLADTTTEAMLFFLSKLAVRVTMGAAIAMFFIALFDTLYQRFQYFKSLRMTRQEVRDEYKQSEGDPMVKNRLRRLRQERARNRMMANVPKADVVITNPTHFAVALQYDTKNMKAPVVVAKGQDLIALKIREVAEENSVPIVENPPLARALYSSTELDEEIPFTEYEAVAKIISYVYGLKGKKMS